MWSCGYICTLFYFDYLHLKILTLYYLLLFRLLVLDNDYFRFVETSIQTNKIFQKNSTFNNFLNEFKFILEIIFELDDDCQVVLIFMWSR